MKPQYQTRYELLHESYQKWLTGFTRHAVSWGVCHPNIHYFHNLTPGWVSFNGEKPAWIPAPACREEVDMVVAGQQQS